jgi:DNA polymerase
VVVQTISIQTLPGFEEWRAAARHALIKKHAPEQIIWQAAGQAQNDLFGGAENHFPHNRDERMDISPSVKVSIPKAFLPLAEAAACHTDFDRFDFLYRILWRLVTENRNLLSHKTDADIMRLSTMVKAVRRDAYKITAFLRFREIEHDGSPLYIAWYEPAYYTLERALPFFKTRFKNMRWSILTPYRAAHWDGSDIYLEDNPDRTRVPQEDQVEQYWLTYYSNIFNPARVKKKAMMSQMPKKYWKNMPETALIEDLLRDAPERLRQMIEAQSEKTIQTSEKQQKN